MSKEGDKIESNNVPNSPYVPGKNEEASLVDALDALDQEQQPDQDHQNHQHQDEDNQLQPTA